MRRGDGGCAGRVVTVHPVMEAKTRAYTGPRPDLFKLIPRDRQKILDVGCATGALGAALKARNRGAAVAGVEIDPAMAAVARKRIDYVALGNIENWDTIGDQVGGPFDCVICGDVLEHLVDPWTTLRNLAGLLADDGIVVISVPNVGHLDTLWSVFVRRNWPHRDRGIHDVTHLRWFAKRNVLQLVEQAGLRIERVKRIYRVVERDNQVNRFAPLFALPGFRDLLTFQFIVVARPAQRP